MICGQQALEMPLQGVAQYHSNPSFGIDFNHIQENPRRFIMINQLPGFASIRGFNHDRTIGDAHRHGCVFIQSPDVAKVFSWILGLASIPLNCIGIDEFSTQNTPTRSAQPNRVIRGSYQSAIVWRFLRCGALRE